MSAVTSNGVVETFRENPCPFITGVGFSVFTNIGGVVLLIVGVLAVSGLTPGVGTVGAGFLLGTGTFAYATSFALAAMTIIKFFADSRKDPLGFGNGDL